MFKKFLSLCIILLVPVFLLGQVNLKNLDRFQLNQEFKLPQITLKATPLFETNNNTPPQITAYQQIDRVIDATFSLYGKITPIVFEPKTNTLITAQAIRLRGASDTDPMIGVAYLKYSTNYGSTWSDTVQIFRESGKIPVWLSLAVLNPDDVTNPRNFYYIVSGPLAEYNAAQQNYPWKGIVYILSQPGSVEFFDVFGPTPTQRFFWGRTESYETPNNLLFYNVGSLVPATGNPLGNYGIGIIDLLNDFDFILPDQWKADKFRQTEDPTQSHYNSEIEFGLDDNGNLYTAVLNFIRPDETNRVVGISKSTNFGKTWSNFDPMPISVLNTYIQDNGGDISRIPFPGQIPYQTNGFVVTGEDEYSFITRVWIWWVENDTLRVKGHLVEINKKKGAPWLVRTITDYNVWDPLSGEISPFIIQDVAPAEATNLKDSIVTSRLGNEIQAAKTKDGQYIVCKWTDFTNIGVPVSPAVTIADGEIVINEINQIDVFFAYRNLNTGQWSTPQNVTNDPIPNKCTWIPDIVPSLETIPMISLQTVQATNTQHPRYSYPNIIQQYCIDQNQNVMFTNVNLLAQNVEYQPNPQLTFDIRNVYPNPASNYIEISFTNEKENNLRLELYNSLGQKVKAIYNGNVEIGLNALYVDVTDIPTGVYFLTLTNGSQSITKQINIVK